MTLLFAWVRWRQGCFLKSTIRRELRAETERRHREPKPRTQSQEGRDEREEKKEAGERRRTTAKRQNNIQNKYNG